MFEKVKNKGKKKIILSKAIKSENSLVVGIKNLQSSKDIMATLKRVLFILSFNC